MTPSFNMRLSIRRDAATAARAIVAIPGFSIVVAAL